MCRFSVQSCIVSPATLVVRAADWEGVSVTNDELMVRVAMLEGIVAELLKRETMRVYVQANQVAGAELGEEVGRTVRAIASGLPNDIQERISRRLDLLLAIVNKSPSETGPIST